MTNDIAPLVAVSTAPQVREKRHYNNERKQPKKQKKTSSDDDTFAENSSVEDLPQNTVNTDKKGVKVGHIDEYV